MTLEIKKNKGLTIIEIILSITIIAVLLGLSASYYNNSQVRIDVSTQAKSIVHYLRLAQSNASSGLNDVNHGVHFEESSYTMFQGNLYDPNSQTNFRIDLPDTIMINNINLNGGGSDVVFSKTNGESDDYGSISVYSANIDKTIPITITPAGTINY